ncbi:MAG TPA: extradiol ring-cleavage dioxygenase [Candidatus Binatia bacterium]
MGMLVSGLASSHANTLVDPSRWDERRERNRSMYRRRYHVEPPNHPNVALETLEVKRQRYQSVRKGLDFLRTQLHEKKPDALILIGDDQDENFSESNLPQVALYLGERFIAVDRHTSGAGEVRKPYRCHAELAAGLLNGLVERGFDLSYAKSFPRDELLAHAHAPVLSTVLPEAEIPVVLLFVNAIHMPAISPSRCYSLGWAVKEIVEGLNAVDRVAIYASGGLSHFTAGYPWPFYKGPHGYGSICEEFDRRILESMARGEGTALGSLTSQDLLDHGEIELRSWITLLGAMEKAPAKVLAYEPFYSAPMAMSVAYWDLENGES